MAAVDEGPGIFEVLKVGDDLIERGGPGQAHEGISMDRDGEESDETSFPRNHPKRTPHMLPTLPKSAL